MSRGHRAPGGPQPGRAGPAGPGIDAGRAKTTSNAEGLFFRIFFAPYLVSCRESQPGLTPAAGGGSLPFSRLGDGGCFPKSFVNGDLFFPVFRSVLVAAAVKGSVLPGTGPCSPPRAGTGHPGRLPPGHGPARALQTANPRPAAIKLRHRPRTERRACDSNGNEDTQKQTPEKQRNKISEGINKAFFCAGKENALPALPSRCLSHRPLAPG